MDIKNYKVFYYSSKSYTKLKDITKIERQKYFEAVQYVLFYIKFQELFEIVKINVFDFWSCLCDISEKHRLNFIFADYNDAIDSRLFLNQKILNILSSFKTFEDHLSHQISLLLGNNDDIYLNYKTKDKTLYDEYFGYRLFKRLRNYTQHFGLPIRSIKYLHRGISPNCKLNIYSVAPCMKKEELLQFKGWSTVKNEIKSLEEDIDIREYVNEFFYAFKILFKSIESEISVEYKKCKKLLDKLYNECIVHSNENPEKYNLMALLVYIQSNDNDKDIFMIPKDTINRINIFERKNVLNSQKDSVSFSLDVNKIPF